jgi:hypothetical protein
MKGMSSGVHLVLRTSRETISVHLGPEWYIENQDIKITPKDKVDRIKLKIKNRGGRTYGTC